MLSLWGPVPHLQFRSRAAMTTTTTSFLMDCPQCGLTIPKGGPCPDCHWSENCRAPTGPCEKLCHLHASHVRRGARWSDYRVHVDQGHLFRRPRCLLSDRLVDCRNRDSRSDGSLRQEAVSDRVELPCLPDPLGRIGHRRRPLSELRRPTQIEIGLPAVSAESCLEGNEPAGGTGVSPVHAEQSSRQWSVTALARPASPSGLGFDRPGSAMILLHRG